MQKFRVLKLIGVSALTMIALVTISFLEVALYSILIPGQEPSFYQAHARISAPWVSAIAGFIVFFFVVRYLCRRNFRDPLQLAIYYPSLYLGMDLTILLLFTNVNWSTFYVTILGANIPKFIGSLLAYTVFSRR